MSLDPTRRSVAGSDRVQTAPGAASVARGSSSFVRRAERCIGLAIRKGQEEGRITKSRRVTGRVPAEISSEQKSPKEIVSGGKTIHETYAMTDNVTDEQFDAAIEAAKDAARAWLDLLPWSEPEDVRELLDERGAFELHERGVRDLDVTDAVTARVVADVLAVVLGHPSAVIEGEAIV